VPGSYAIVRAIVVPRSARTSPSVESCLPAELADGQVPKRLYPDEVFGSPLGIVG
jgi:hypothetical protein